MTNKSNVYNLWQRFCANSNIPKNEMRKLYDLHKNQIKGTNPTLWFDFIKNIVLQEKKEEKSEDNKEEEEQETAGKEKDENSDTLIRDIYVTLNEIKTFLSFLCSEPSRHVRSYISFEEKSDENILNKWGVGMQKIMETLRNTEQYNANSLVIDLKQIFHLINDNILNMPQVDKFSDISFIPVNHESDVRVKLLFESKRKKYLNEYIVPTIMQHDNSSKTGVYFFYDTLELLNVIEQRYRNEVKYHSSYITTAQSKLAEQEFYYTHVVLITLHAMIHLLCSMLYKKAFLSHEDSLYYKTVENIVPRSLFKYFIMPNIH